jgi:hypothetical protein
MKIKPKKYSFIIAITLMSSLILLDSCELDDIATPTNELMEGVWQLEEAFDENDSLITDDITTFFPAFVHLDDMNSVNSTLGPAFMYIVYGDSRFIDVTSKFDEVFTYTDLALTEGEWFIDKNKSVDNFTIEIKMRFPTLKTLNEVFELLQLDLPEIAADAIDIIVYHKFKFVKVEISDANPDIMVWEFTDEVVPTYNTKDKYGDPVMYTGISTDSYTRCRLVFNRKVKSIEELVMDAS